MPAPKKYSDELRERATRLAVEARRDPASAVGAIRRIADQLGAHPEALRVWVKQAETDTGGRPGTTSGDAGPSGSALRQARQRLGPAPQGTAMSGVKRQYMGCAGRVSKRHQHGLPGLRAGTDRPRPDHRPAVDPRRASHRPGYRRADRAAPHAEFRTKGQLAIDLCTHAYADLPKVVDTMQRLALLWCPELPQLKRAERRWAAYVEPADLSLLRGDTLLHTDYSPDNVLIDGDAARLIDWAWPTLGAGFIDPSCLIVRLILAGHTSERAEACVSPAPAWTSATTRAVDVFASALARMSAQIAAADPHPWKNGMAEAALAWEAYRRATLRMTESSES